MDLHALPLQYAMLLTPSLHRLFLLPCSAGTSAGNATPASGPVPPPSPAPSVISGLAAPPAASLAAALASQGLALPPLPQLQTLLAGAQLPQVPPQSQGQQQPALSSQPGVSSAGLMQRVQAAEELAQAVLVSLLLNSVQTMWGLC